MHAPLELHETPTGTDRCTLAVGGELDLATAAQFRTTVGALLGTGCRHLVVDLADTTFVDSSGLGALVGAARRADPGTCVVAACANPRVVRVFRTTGTDRIVPVYPTVEAALAAATRG